MKSIKKILEYIWYSICIVLGLLTGLCIYPNLLIGVLVDILVLSISAYFLIIRSDRLENILTNKGR